MVRASRIVEAPLEEVWALVADLERAPRWNRAWARVAIEGEPRVGALVRAWSVEGEEASFRLVEWRPPFSLALAPVLAPGEEGPWLFLLEQRIELRPAKGPRRTLVSMEARARLRGLRGLVLGLILWPGYQRRGLAAALEALAALAEGG